MFGYKIRDVINSDAFSEDIRKKISHDLFENPLSGAIFWTDLGNDANGSKQSGKRPCIVYNNFTQDSQITTSIIVPLTSRLKKLDNPVHFVIQSSIANGLEKDSMVLTEKMTSKENSELFSPTGMITYEEFLRLEEMMEIQFPMLKSISKEDKSKHNQMLEQYFDMINKAIEVSK